MTAVVGDRFKEAKRAVRAKLSKSTVPGQMRGPQNGASTSPPNGAVLCAASLRGWVDQGYASEKIRAQGTDWRFFNEHKKEAEGMIGRYDVRPDASAIAAAVRGSGDRVVRRSSRRRCHERHPWRRPAPKKLQLGLERSSTQEESGPWSHLGVKVR